MIYSYQKHIDDIRTVEMRLPESGMERLGQELATIDGITYVFVPDTATLPPQPPEITVTPIILTDALREQLKAESPHCQLIDARIQEKIREKYSAEDEMYYARISVGVLMGAYTYQNGEQQAVLDYGVYVESVRQWARAERSKLGL